MGACDSGSTEDSSLQTDPGPLLMDSPMANLLVEIQDFPPQSSLGPGQKVQLFHLFSGPAYTPQ